MRLLNIVGSLSWPHSGFNIRIGPRLHPDGGDTLEATLRYPARAPISLWKLHSNRANRQVTYSSTSANDQGSI